ncbi:MAG: DUF4136 domain-containing protein [Novosphingobium sp.]
MHPRLLLALPVLLLASAPLAAKPVEVTRFHTPETLARLAPGTVAVVPAPDLDPASLETRTWLAAVAEVMAARGFPAGDPASPRLAEVRLTRDELEGGRERSPVSVGVGVGSGGGWRGGTGVGLGLGFGIGGGGRGDRGQVTSELSVVIRDTATGTPLWEGRATAQARAGSREAAPTATAKRLAQALFAGFPGRSGETIEVR